MYTWAERIELFFSEPYKSKEETKSKSNCIKNIVKKMQDARLEEAKTLLKNNRYYW